MSEDQSFNVIELNQLDFYRFLDRITESVNCMNCPYWKECDEPEATKRLHEISGICTNEKKTSFKTIPCLVSKGICDHCISNTDAEEFQEEDARVLIQKDCVPVPKIWSRKLSKGS
jgi:hypothetical protein